MTQKYIDFHMHTFYSDGIEDPKTIVRNAKLSGLDAIAITDHDNILGYFDAKQEAEDWNIELIPGAEITVDKYHILGLYVNPDKDFLDFLAKSREIQKANCAKRVKAIAEAGVPISMEKVTGYFPKSRLGKYNIVMSLVRDRECRETLESQYGYMPHNAIFKKFFSRPDGIANIVSSHMPANQAIDAIHKAGGIAILAHAPKDIKSLEEVDKLLELGLDGVEIQPNYKTKELTLKQYEELEQYARNKNLIITYGSDYHGIAFKHRPMLGRGENIMNDILQEAEYA